MGEQGVAAAATITRADVAEVCGARQVEEALGIFQDMVARGCERNVITYSSLIVAAEKAGRWQLALELLEEMHRDGCSPNAVTFNTILSACAAGAAAAPLPSAWRPLARPDPS